MEKREELLKKYRYILTENQQLEVMQKDVKALQNEYVQLQKKSEEQKTGYGTGTLVKGILPMLLTFLFGVLGISTLILVDIKEVCLFCFGVAILMCGVFYLIVTISFAKNDRDKNEIESVRTYNDEVLPAYKKYIRGKKGLEHRINTGNVKELEEEIPEDYRSKKALKFFVSALEHKRADTEKELYNLYEEELHKQKLKQIEEERLQKLDEGLTHCPDCGSTNCVIMVNNQTNSKSFSFGDACCGYVLLGPFGLLCGLCGADTKTSSETYWVCQNCGKKFKND